MELVDDDLHLDVVLLDIISLNYKYVILNAAIYDVLRVNVDLMNLLLPTIAHVCMLYGIYYFTSD